MKIDLQNNPGFFVVSEQVGELISRFLSDPAFKEIRDKIRQDPDKIEETMEEIKGQSAELYEMLTQNPEHLDQIVETILDGSIAEGEGEDGMDFLTEQEFNTLPPARRIVD